MELGITVSERRVPPDAPPVEDDPVTVKVALELTGPLNPVAVAVIVVVPDPTAVTNPEAFTVATEGAVEAQLTVLVMSCFEL